MLAALEITEQLLKGGVIGFVIVALSVVLLTLAIVHAISLRFAVQCPDELLDAVIERVGQRKTEAAQRMVEEDPSALARVLGPILRERGADAGRMREVLADAAAEQSLRLGQRISWIGVIAAVSPMLGLLGTVSGMVRAFAAMSASGGAADPAVLAGAISEALITTYLGLVVAIPALVVHAALRQRVLAVVLKAGEMGEQLVAAMGNGAAARPRAARAPQRVT